MHHDDLLFGLVSQKYTIVITDVLDNISARTGSRPCPAVCMDKTNLLMVQ